MYPAAVAIQTTGAMTGVPGVTSLRSGVARQSPGAGRHRPGGGIPRRLIRKSQEIPIFRSSWQAEEPGDPRTGACCLNSLHNALLCMSVSGASGKSIRLLAAPRCRIVDVDDAGDDAPRDKDADACSSTPSPPRSL